MVLLNWVQLERFGDISPGVRGEVGVCDLEWLRSKIVSLSVELPVELADLAETFECGIGRGGVSVIIPRDIGTRTESVGHGLGGLGWRREFIRLDNDILRIVYQQNRLSITVSTKSGFE